MRVELARKEALRAQAANNSAVINSVSDTLFTTDSLTTDAIYTLENSKIKVGIQTRGGRVAYVELKEYVTSAGEPLVLWNPDHSYFGLKFENMRETIQTNDILFTPSTTQESQEANNAPVALSMKLNAGPDNYIEYQYTLDPNSYILGFDIITNNMGRAIPGSLTMEWSLDMPQLEKRVLSLRLDTPAFIIRLRETMLKV